ncbi:DUF1405 domain-containing protein [Paenibacillus monticola]|uniref:DUF1405 domain-containing protein n=1 Tax=Paenibacillus monticola TaxID=2666075 RepID=A0A7X2H4I9_9BACL|nr:DUF1405 domain-containing protein [Paenibacillus monticola]MRN53360.1 DUF1405 domain-containing protein [Paenibacillus monticola]
MPVHWFEKLFKHRGILWLLFIVNLLGTIYGYIWYGNQMEFTAANYPLWLLPFVPDSPTASLFFTLALLLLLFPPKRFTGVTIKGIIEALAVVTSVKYGIWAVSIIIAGGYQGDVLTWKDWMLMGSHTGMAVEALLYAGFFSYRKMLPLALIWTLFNDVVDYSYGVYPWLPFVLEDNVIGVQYFTFALTLLSVAVAWLFRERSKLRITSGKRASS